MIDFANKPAHHRYVELGGGDNPHPATDVRVDIRPGPYTNFCADFNEPLPISTGEFDGCFAQFVIEHLSWRKVEGFIAEVFRILRPGGSACLITANTEAQLDYIRNNPKGWDGRNPFKSFSCVLFGDQDYPENTHRNFMSPTIAHELFVKAGFEKVQTQGYGALNTDMLIIARKPISEVESIQLINTNIQLPPEEPISEVPATVLFDKDYFNGGGKYGGYAREGYWDFPIHEITAAKILALNPASVLELGCARGYVLKRIQDAGVPGIGLEVSKHCVMTAVAENVRQFDLCKTDDSLAGTSYDLAYSIAVFEHIPENKLPDILRHLQVRCRRGLHGIDFGQHDDGFDKTHCTLKSKEWWRATFDHYGLESHEIVDKEEMERGEISPYVIQGDGKVKLNLGSFTTMFHHGWTNLDIVDLGGFAAHYGYKYQHCNVKQGLPFSTCSVDLIYSSHMWEHLTYTEGLQLLKECRRVLKPDGAIRIIVPSASILLDMHAQHKLSEFDEINDDSAKATTSIQKLHHLLYGNHLSIYDGLTMAEYLREAGFTPHVMSHRKGIQQTLQIRKETLDMLPCLSLYVDAVPCE